MGTTETYQYVSEDPRFVAYKEGLLQDASDFVRQQMGFNQVPVLDDQGQPVLNKQGQPTFKFCLLYTSPSPRDGLLSRMPSSA